MATQPMPEGWKTVTLGELLTEEQLRRVRLIIWRGGTAKEIREYLEEFREVLQDKGVEPGYLAYAIEHIAYTRLTPAQIEAAKRQAEHGERG